MIEEISGTMCVIDPGGRVIWANREFDQWFSWDGMKAVGKGIESLFPGLYRECPKGIVLAYTDHKGLKHYLEARCETTYDENGKEISSLISFKDVTLLQILLNISVLTMSTTTPEALLDNAIGTISETFGYRTIAALLYGGGYLELSVSRGYSPMLQSLLSRQKVSADERGLAGRSAYTATVITKEIKAETVSPKLLEESLRLDIRWATTIPLTDPNGLLGVLAFSTSAQPDIDEIDLLKIVCNQITVSLRKILFEEALVSARNELEMYVDLMCHDITNAIQISLGYLELVEKEVGNKDYGYITSSMNSLHKINRLIGTVRTLRNAPGIKITSVSVKSALDGALAMLKCDLFGEEKDVTIDAEGVADLSVRANVLLTDVIFNLLESTTRRIRHQSLIRIWTEQTNHECKLILEDNGPGMVENLIPKPGQAVPVGNMHELPGIGMYFVYNLIKSYGGTIIVEERIPGHLEQGNRVILLFKCA